MRLHHLAARGEDAGDVVRGAVLRFAAWSLVTWLLLSLGILVVSNEIAEGEALRDARNGALTLSRDLVGPLVDAELRAGDPGRAERLERILAPRFREEGLHHIKLWARDGTIIWSDLEEEVGKRFEMEPDVQDLFGTWDATSEVSDLERPENVQERAEGELLEVYAGAYDADQVPFVFEAYSSTEPIEENQRAIFMGILPVGLGALGLFQLAILPLALSLARRLRSHQAERETVMRHALLASDLERRRIARDLHDGVIQDLAGVAFALRTVEDGLTEDDRGARARHTLDQATGILRSDLAALRTMMLEVYPPDFSTSELEPKIDELVERSRSHGVPVDVEYDVPEALPAETAALTYRVIREGLHNVRKHSGASAAEVVVLARQGHLIVQVGDNGRGPVREGPAEPGHLGLVLLEQAVRDAHGSMTVSAKASGGTLLEVLVPLDVLPARAQGSLRRPQPA